MTRSSHFFLLILLTAVIGCMAQRSEIGPGTRSVPDTAQDLQPASELALLMRALALHADSVKAAVLRGDKLPPYPEKAKTLFTATPTEGMAIDPITYPTFGNDYLKKLDALYQAPKKQRQQAYNALVQGCANCHTTHCPGPMMRIKKMYAPVSQ